MAARIALKGLLGLALACSAQGDGPIGAESARWAVIAAGSAGFFNYRHQADACHAYHVLRKSGIPEERIILMMQDDVASSKTNPFPGKLFNRPGTDVPDVYEGCKVDYRGAVVTAKLFQAVITGNLSGVPAGGKVLKSSSSDDVFLNFIDHGGVGIIAFPNGPFLHAVELNQSLEVMKEKKMFKQLVFYMEACESGSMFPTLGTHDKIFAVTASNAKESSWGYYCMPQNDTVNGHHMGTCLGDLFSIAWMEDSDLGQIGSETIREQVKRVTKRTNKSHVTQFGDTSFEDEPIGDFQLDIRWGASTAAAPAADENGAIGVRDIGLQTAWHRWSSARTPQQKAEAWREYQRVKADREADNALFDEVVARACADAGPSCVRDAKEDQEDLRDLDCHYDLAMTVHKSCPRRVAHDAGGWNGFNMQYSQTLANLCEKRQLIAKTKQDLLDIVHSACRESSEAALRASIGDLEESLRIGGVVRVGGVADVEILV